VKPERGNVSVLMVAAVVLAAMLCLGLARLAHAATERARADSAADAAALAAADQLALGHSSSAAAAVARATAADNGAQLLDCTCRGAVAVVRVSLGDARAVARADVG
jgi:secretion/DNA translocation related TadE-like protein